MCKSLLDITHPVLYTDQHSLVTDVTTVSKASALIIPSSASSNQISPMCSLKANDLAKTPRYLYDVTLTLEVLLRCLSSNYAVNNDRFELFSASPNALLLCDAPWSIKETDTLVGMDLNRNTHKAIEKMFRKVWKDLERETVWLHMLKNMKGCTITLILDDLNGK